MVGKPTSVPFHPDAGSRLPRGFLPFPTPDNDPKLSAIIARMKHHSLVALVAALVLVALPLAARVKVQVGFDPAVDFSPFKTYAWPADGAGQVKMAVTKDDDPDALKARFEPVIVANVDQSLLKKGFQKAAPGQPADFLVTYFALVSVSTSGQTMGQFLPGTVAWGLPPFAAVSTSLKIYEQGSLVLEIMTPERQPIWRGMAQAEVHRDRTQAQREKRLAEVVTDVLKQFPPNKKK
jgi:hypothetical protein